jgi:hypothetical protein
MAQLSRDVNGCLAPVVRLLNVCVSRYQKLHDREDVVLRREVEGGESACIDHVHRDAVREEERHALGAVVDCVCCEVWDEMRKREM